MYQKFTILLLLLLVLVLPFLFIKKDASSLAPTSEEKLVIITIHNEALRYEFTRGFKKWYFDKYKKSVDIDWRVSGGGSREVTQYVDPIYVNLFKLHWENDLGKKWNQKVINALNERTKKRSTIKDPFVLEVIEAFEKADIGCGLDIFFGGGKIDTVYQAKKSQLVPSGIFERHPEWFKNESIPFSVAGNELLDPQYRWIGTAISSFGIIYNKEALKSKGLNFDNASWEDLAREELVGEVALTDPSVSGTFTMAFEIIIQYHIQKALNQYKDKSKAVQIGWLEGIKLIQKISANGRYFTDAATKPVLDVTAGDCLAGMAIDFYGLFQEENLRKRSNSDRFGIVIPKNASLISPDPIAMFKGAPNPKLALDFIEYTLSIEGQKLWDYKVGVQGGPALYAISRSPIRKELYSEEHMKNRNNPELNLYEDVGTFIYHPEWTASLFKELRFIIKVACVDAHTELVAAWKAIIQAKKEGRAQDARLALEHLEQLDSVSYQKANNEIKTILSSGNPLKEIQLQSAYTKRFRNIYQQAKSIAEGKL